RNQARIPRKRRQGKGGFSCNVMDGKRAANLPRKREKTRFATLKNGHYAGETGSPLTASSARESASNRCVFVVSSLVGEVLILPRVSAPANASAATRDAKCLGAGRERPQGLSRPFSSRRMWSVSAGFCWRVR